MLINMSSFSLCIVMTHEVWISGFRNTCRLVTQIFFNLITAKCKSCYWYQSFSEMNILTVINSVYTLFIDPEISFSHASLTTMRRGFHTFYPPQINAVLWWIMKHHYFCNSDHKMRASCIYITYMIILLCVCMQ